MKINKLMLIGIIAVIAIIAAIAIPFFLKPEYNNPDVPRPFKGNPEAQIIVKEYSDFQCPACLASQSAVKGVLEAYSNDVRWEFHHLPLPSLHPNAFNAAMAAECANDQNKFWEMHDLMFANQNNLGRQNLSNLASQAGLDLTLFNACVDSGAKTAFIQQEANEGTALLSGIASTPSFFINNEKIENWAYLESLVAQKIAETK